MEDFQPSIDFPSSHGLNISTALELGRKLGYKMPCHISLYAVEVMDNVTFDENCTEEVEKRVPFITKHIIDEERL